MKSLKNTSKKVSLTLIAGFALLLPTKVHAASALVNGTGVSDESLFIILLAIAIFQLLAIMTIANVIKSIVSNHDAWKNRWNKSAGVGMITLLFMLSGSQAMAASNAAFDELVYMDDVGFMALITLNLFLFIAFMYLVSKLNGLMRTLMEDEEGRVPETFIDKVREMLTDNVPLEQEKSIEMDHEYDGIRELDNNLPPWWIWGFYFSIFFGVVYIFNYHITGNGQLQLEEYASEMQAAEDAKAQFVATQENAVDESNVELLTDAASIASGGKMFKLYCAPCHGESGGSSPGGVGPNLTDDYWINGGAVTDIFKTIKYGVPEKGMVSWQAQMNPTQIQELSSYIKSLYGTNPENAKEPQGDIWSEPISEEVEAPATEEAEVETAEVEDATLEAADLPTED